MCALHPENEHNRFVTVGGVRIHLNNHVKQNGHGVANPQPGTHYVNGYQARQIYGRRCAEAEVEAENLSLYLEDPNYSVEDFLVDFKPRAA